MKIARLALLVLILFLSGTAHGATELGEFCFSGAFLRDGNCTIRLEATKHTNMYSLAGTVTCADQTISGGISGVATGSGYIDGNTFIGSLTVPHEFGQTGVSFSAVETNSMNVAVNLSDLRATVRKTTTSNELCGPGFIATCIEEVIFTSIVCP